MKRKSTRIIDDESDDDSLFSDNVIMTESINDDDDEGNDFTANRTPPSSTKKRITFTKKKSSPATTTTTLIASTTNTESPVKKRRRTSSNHVNNNNNSSANGDDDDDRSAYNFKLETLHTVSASEYVDSSYSDLGEQTKLTWEKVWPIYVAAVEKKYQVDPAMSSEDVRNISRNWIEALEDTKNRIVGRSVQQILKSSKEFTQYDIRVDDRRFNLVSDLLRRLNAILQRDERRTDSNINKLISLKKRATARKEKEAKEAEVNEREWQTLKQKDDQYQLKYFVSRFGPLKGRKEYSEWKGCISLSEGVSLVADNLDIAEELKGGGGGSEKSKKKSNLDQMLEKSEQMVDYAKAKMTKASGTSSNTTATATTNPPARKTAVRSRSKHDVDYDDLLDGDLF